MIQTRIYVCCDTIAQRIQHLDPPQVFAAFNEGELYPKENLEFFRDRFNGGHRLSEKFQFTEGLKVVGYDRKNIHDPREFDFQQNLVSEDNYRRFLNAVIFGNIYYGVINKICNL